MIVEHETVELCLGDDAQPDPRKRGVAKRPALFVWEDQTGLSHLRPSNVLAERRYQRWRH
jgi:hypothetical protein